ncbi:MAG: thioredoxin family protein, partial [Halanaerobium sp.]
VNSDKPALVAFWSVTDQESMDIVSELESMELEDQGYKFIKIDTYKNRLISNRYDIEEIPTLLKLESGKVASKLVRPEKEEIEAII